MDDTYMETSGPLCWGQVHCWLGEGVYHHSPRVGLKPNRRRPCQHWAVDSILEMGSPEVTILQEPKGIHIWTHTCAPTRTHKML